MKKLILIAHIALLVILCSSCKKESTNPVADIKDCEKSNYGIARIYFGSTTERHSIIVTYSPSSARDKIVNTGMASDTLHLVPGTYTLSISSINSMGQAIGQTTEKVIITQCNEDAVSVAF